jgi:hypothetical protein
VTCSHLFNRTLQGHLIVAPWHSQPAGPRFSSLCETFKRANYLIVERKKHRILRLAILEKHRLPVRIVHMAIWNFLHLRASGLFMCRDLTIVSLQFASSTHRLKQMGQTSTIWTNRNHLHSKRFMRGPDAIKC